jgi:hypothetical protein
MRPLFSLVDLSLFDTFSGFTLASIPASVSVSAVPVPAAIWLFGIGMIGLGFARRKQQPGFPVTS